MSGIPNPNNVAPANVGADELPDGFSLGSGPGSGGGSSAAADQAAQRDAQRQAILEQAMTADALARLRRVKLVKRERASAVEAMIANMALQGQMDSKITEGKLIEMLERIEREQSKKKGDTGKINIQRKKYNFDSDSDDDNDDDLL